MSAGPGLHMLSPMDMADLMYGYLAPAAKRKDTTHIELRTFLLRASPRGVWMLTMSAITGISHVLVALIVDTGVAATRGICGRPTEAQTYAVVAHLQEKYHYALTVFMDIFLTRKIPILRAEVIGSAWNVIVGAKEKFSIERGIQYE